MESETFKMRKQFIEEFYNEDRINFLKCCINIYIKNAHYNSILVNDFYIETEPVFKLPIINMFKFVCNLLKPYTYFLYSITRYTKFLPDKPLFFNGLEIRYSKFMCTEDEIGRYTVYFDISDCGYPPNCEDFNFLKSIRIKDFLNESVNELIYLNMKLKTKYLNVNHLQYRRLREVVTTIYTDADMYNINYMEEDEEDEDENNKIINFSQSFKSEECVICLTNPPNVLFCNCGHLCLCSECKEMGKFNKCPICKFENKIIRVLEL